MLKGALEKVESLQSRGISPNPTSSSLGQLDLPSCSYSQATNRPRSSAYEEHSKLFGFKPQCGYKCKGKGRATAKPKRTKATCWTKETINFVSDTLSKQRLLILKRR